MSHVRRVEEIPGLFRKKAFHAADLAVAVNHFVALGEKETVRQLIELAPHAFMKNSNNFQLHERVGWLCRILFLPQKAKSLRPPRYGMLIGTPHLTMLMSNWPLYPVTQAGDSFFVLSEGYSLGGQPEHPTNYLKYCCTEGSFRQKPIAVPTRTQAQKDVMTLRQSPAWKAIKWRDSSDGSRYFIPEEEFLVFIQAQADSIEEDR